MAPELPFNKFLYSSTYFKHNSGLQSCHAEFFLALTSLHSIAYTVPTIQQHAGTHNGISPTPKRKSTACKDSHLKIV